MRAHLQLNESATQQGDLCQDPCKSPLPPPFEYVDDGSGSVPLSPGTIWSPAAGGGGNGSDDSWDVVRRAR